MSMKSHHDIQSFENEHCSSSSYSNLKHYGTKKWRPIEPPTFVTFIPSIFDNMKPYTLPDSFYKKDHTHCKSYSYISELPKHCHHEK